MSGLLQGAGSRFRIEPDPPVAGKPLKVFYLGPATTVEWQVDGKDPIRVKPNTDGGFTIPSVPPGTEIMFSDLLGLPGYLHRRIVHLQ